MNKRTIYISIPMSGYDMQLQRLRATMWQHYFEALGYTVINPFDLADKLKNAFENIAGREPTYDEYLHEDIVNIENECTDIFLVNGWANSYGCMAEVDTSIKQNLKFHYEKKIIVG